MAMMKSPNCPDFVGKSNANSGLHSVDFNFNEIKHPDSKRSSIFDSKATHLIDKDKSFLDKVKELSYPVSSLASFLGPPSMPALKKQRRMEKTASWNQLKAPRESEQQFYSVGNKTAASGRKQKEEKSQIMVERVLEKDSDKQSESESEGDEQLGNIELKETGAE